MQNSTSASTEKNLSTVVKIDEAQIQQHLAKSQEKTLRSKFLAFLCDRKRHCSHSGSSFLRSDSQHVRGPRGLHGYPAWPVISSTPDHPVHHVHPV